MSGLQLKARKKPFQILIEATPDDLLQLTTLPSNLFDKAEQKLQAWKQEGLIDNFILEKSLQNWSPAEHRQSLNALPDDYPLRFVIGQGFKALTNITVSAPKKTTCSISVQIVDSPELPKKVEGWSFHDFYSNLRFFAEKANLNKPVKANCQYVFASLKKAPQGGFFDICQSSPTHSNQDYQLRYTPEGAGIIIEIFKSSYLISPQKRKEFLIDLNAKIKVEKSKAKITLFNEAIVEELKAASRGKAVLDIEMPVTIFAGFRQIAEPAKPEKSKSAPAKAKSEKTDKKPTKAGASADPSSTDKPKKAKKKKKKKSPASGDISKAPGSHQAAQEAASEMPQKPELPEIPDSYPGRGLLNVKVSDDHMSAAIIEFNTRWYDSGEYQFDDTWLKYEMIRLKISRYDAEFLKRTHEALRRSADPNNLVIVEGDPGTPPTEAFIQELKAPAEDSAKQSSEDTESEGDVDMRKSAINTTKVGQKIAEWGFKVPGAAGETIYGDPTPPPPPELPTVTLGAGAEEREDGYYATIEGLVSIDPSRYEIDVQKTYVIEGDVSLVTGDIIFDGGVVVEGDIRDNATVKCTESLTVTGNISGAKAIAGKGITVEGGIVKSSVKAGLDIKADFIENSDLNLGGHLTVERNLYNSNIVATSIRVLGDPGLIAGGRIFCSDHIYSNYLGFEADNPTVVNMGLNWRYANRISVSEARLVKGKDVEEEAEKSLKLFKSKTAAQMTKAHKETLKELEDKVKRIKKIMRKLKSKIGTIKPGADDHNQLAEIVTLEDLYGTSEIYMGTNKVKLIGSYKNVKVEYNKKAGTHVHALPEDYVMPAVGTKPEERKGSSSAAEELPDAG